MNSCSLYFQDNNNLSREELIDFCNVVEEIPLIVLITNKEGEIEYVNQKFQEITGYSFYEVRGKNPRFLKSGKRSQKEYQTLWNRITSGKEWKGEFDNLTKSGKLYWVNATISPIKNKEGKITHFIAIEEDITEKKKNREKIRKERDLAQKYLDVARAIIILLDKDGKIEMINQKGCEILGAESKRLVGKDWFGNFIPSQEVEKLKKYFISCLVKKRVIFTMKI
jgi:PAS domain S-box